MQEQYPKPSRATVKLAMSLKRKKYREIEKMSTIEGRKLIEEALNSSIPLYAAFFTIDAIRTNQDLVSKIASRNVKLYRVSPGEMERLSPLKSPPGCLAIYQSDFIIPVRRGNIITALYKISQPGNLGSVIRTADWFGVAKVILSDESAELHNPSTVRGSMGAVFRMPIERYDDFSEIILKLKEQNHKIALSVTRGGINPQPLPGKVVLVTGDEQGTLPQKVADLADVKFTIPKYGKGESLNLASAVSVILYAMTHKQEMYD